MTCNSIFNYNYKYFQLQFFLIYFKDAAEESTVSCWNWRTGPPKKHRCQKRNETNINDKTTEETPV